MKPLYPILLLCFSLPALSQNYNLFPNPSDTLAFRDTSGIISHVKFDSVKTSGNSTSYFPVGEYVLNLSSGCSGTIDFDGWLGGRIVDSVGYWKFISQEYELEFSPDLKTSSPVQAGWLKRYGSEYNLQVQYDSTAFKLLYNGQQDSVRYFTLIALDSAGRKPTDPASNEDLKIAVAKNHGLQAFPYLPGNREEMWYSQNLKRIKHDVLLKSDIFDFQVGDEFHYSTSSISWANPSVRQRYWMHSKYILIERNDIAANDSLFYRWQHTWTHYEPSFGPDTTYGVDTLGMSFGNVSQISPPLLSFVGANKYTFSGGQPGGPFYHYSHQDIINGRKGHYYNRSGFEYDSLGCFFAFEPHFLESWFAEGLGEVKTEAWDGGYAIETTRKLVYYKKGTETWGSPYNDVGLKNPKYETLSFYPNPAENQLIFSFGTQSQGLDLVITDISGKPVISTNISIGSPSIDISELAPGVYILKTKTGTAKLVKRPAFR